METSTVSSWKGRTHTHTITYVYIHKYVHMMTNMCFHKFHLVSHQTDKNSENTLQTNIPREKSRETKTLNFPQGGENSAGYIFFSKFLRENVFVKGNVCINIFLSVCLNAGSSSTATCPCLQKALRRSNEPSKPTGRLEEIRGCSTC